MREGALWVHTFFGDAGIPSEIVETAGHPAVIADTGPAQGDGPVVLVYGHYDVQPVGDEKLWDSPPFEATIRDGDLFARGSADDKGQVFTHMLAAKSWMKIAGEVPVRLKPARGAVAPSLLDEFLSASGMSGRAFAIS